MKACGAEFGEQGRAGPLDGFGWSGNWGQTLHQGAQVETGAAGDDGQPRRFLTHGGERHLAPPPGRTPFGSAKYAIEAMGCRGEFARAGPRRQDRQFAINLHAAGVDDRAIEFAGNGQGESRFAARRRACDDDERSAADRRPSIDLAHRPAIGKAARPGGAAALKPAPVQPWSVRTATHWKSPWR